MNAAKLFILIGFLFVSCSAEKKAQRQIEKRRAEMDAYDKLLSDTRQRYPCDTILNGVDSAEYTAAIAEYDAIIDSIYGNPKGRDTIQLQGSTSIIRVPYPVKITEKVQVFDNALLEQLKNENESLKFGAEQLRLKYDEEVKKSDDFRIKNDNLNSRKNKGWWAAGITWFIIAGCTAFFVIIWIKNK